jgi:hypothetical protein
MLHLPQVWATLFSPIVSRDNGSRPATCRVPRHVATAIEKAVSRTHPECTCCSGPIGRKGKHLGSYEFQLISSLWLRRA